MLREDPSHNPPLMPYASHVAEGTARTPIGIILFAASHLLLGAVLMLAAFGLLRWVLLRRSLPGALVVLAAALLAIPMLSGGIALLLKGRGAHATAMTSFALLAVLEAAALAYATGMTVRYLRQGNPDLTWALVFLALAALLGYLCRVVVGYLAGRKARATFALPPGELHRAVRLLPAVVVALYAIACVVGPMLSGLRWLYPD